MSMAPPSEVVDKVSKNKSHPEKYKLCLLLIKTLLLPIPFEALLDLQP